MYTFPNHRTEKQLITSNDLIIFVNVNVSNRSIAEVDTEICSSGIRHSNRSMSHLARNVRVRLKLGQIGPKWDKCRIFKAQFHFGSASQNVLKLILKSSRFVAFGCQSELTCMPNSISMLAAT